MILSLISLIASHADCTTVLLFVVVAYLTWKAFRGYNLPPGPWGLPLLGYLPFMGSDPAEETFNRLSKKYGDVMSFYFGDTLVVVLNSFEMIKEAFQKQGDLFSGRPHNIQMRIEEDDAGLIITEGDRWKEQRRFVISTLRDYGMGKLSLEPRIMEEIHAFLDILAEQKGRPFDITDALSLSAANIISTLEFGKRFDYKDPRYVKLCDLQHELLQLNTTLNPVVFSPWLEYIPFMDRLTNMKRIREVDRETKEFLDAIVKEHKSEYLENSRKDLIDAFFSERDEQLKKNGHAGSFNDKELQGDLYGLFQGGTEATTSSMKWGLLYMMVNPEIQKKVREEIDDVIGMERDPTITDRMHMVYTDAVLQEIQRLGPIGPLGVPHTNLEETELAGYRIPKRSVILPNIYAALIDPKLWDQPEKFKPERFISKEGKLIKPEYLINFGIGKRVCAGESLARMQNFLYFVSLLQRFEFKPPEGVTPTLDYESIVVRRPKPYKLRAIQRPGYAA